MWRIWVLYQFPSSVLWSCPDWLAVAFSRALRRFALTGSCVVPPSCWCSLQLVSFQLPCISCKNWMSLEFGVHEPTDLGKIHKFGMLESVAMTRRIVSLSWCEHFLDGRIRLLQLRSLRGCSTGLLECCLYLGVASFSADAQQHRFGVFFLGKYAKFWTILESPQILSCHRIPQVGCMIRRAKQQLAKKMEEWKKQDEADESKTMPSPPSVEPGDVTLWDKHHGEIWTKNFREKWKKTNTKELTNLGSLSRSKNWRHRSSTCKLVAVAFLVSWCLLPWHPWLLETFVYFFSHSVVELHVLWKNVFFCARGVAGASGISEFSQHQKLKPVPAALTSSMLVWLFCGDLYQQEKRFKLSFGATNHGKKQCATNRLPMPTYVDERLLEFNEPFGTDKSSSSTVFPSFQ